MGDDEFVQPSGKTTPEGKDIYVAKPTSATVQQQVSEKRVQTFGSGGGKLSDTQRVAVTSGGETKWVTPEKAKFQSAPGTLKFKEAEAKIKSREKLVSTIRQQLEIIPEDTPEEERRQRIADVLRSQGKEVTIDATGNIISTEPGSTRKTTITSEGRIVRTPISATVSSPFTESYIKGKKSFIERVSMPQGRIAETLTRQGKNLEDFDNHFLVYSDVPGQKTIIDTKRKVDDPMLLRIPKSATYKRGFGSNIGTGIEKPEKWLSKQEDDTIQLRKFKPSDFARGYKKGERTVSLIVKKSGIFDTSWIDEEMKLSKQRQASFEEEGTKLSSLFAKGEEIGRYPLSLEKGWRQDKEEKPVKNIITTAAFFGLPKLLKLTGSVMAATGVKVWKPIQLGFGLGLPSLYGASIYSRVKSQPKSKQWEELGRIQSSEIEPMIIGSLLGTKYWQKLEGIYRTRGMKKVPAEKLISKKVLSGGGLDEYPPSQHLKLFKEAKNPLDEIKFQSKKPLSSKPLKIAFDLDQTLINKRLDLRPGTKEVLTLLKKEGHSINLFTHSSKVRAEKILKRKGIFDLFDNKVYREDYALGKSSTFNKDISKYNFDVLIDNDPAIISRLLKSGQKGILIKKYNSYKPNEILEWNNIYSKIYTKTLKIVDKSPLVVLHAASGSKQTAFTDVLYQNKNLKILQGGDYIRGGFVAPSDKLAAGFLGVGKGGKYEERFSFNLFSPYSEPTAVAVYPKGVRLRGSYSVGKASKTGQILRKFKGKDILGVVDIPRIKTEPEGILPPMTELIPKNSRFYVNWRGVRVPIKEYDVLSKLTITRTTKPVTFGGVSKSLEVPRSSSLTPGSFINIPALSKYIAPRSKPQKDYRLKSIFDDLYKYPTSKPSKYSKQRSSRSSRLKSSLSSLLSSPRTLKSSLVSSQTSSLVSSALSSISSLSSSTSSLTSSTSSSRSSLLSSSTSKSSRTDFFKDTTTTGGGWKLPSLEILGKTKKPYYPPSANFAYTPDFIASIENQYAKPFKNLKTKIWTGQERRLKIKGWKFITPLPKVKQRRIKKVIRRKK